MTAVAAIIRSCAPRGRPPLCVDQEGRIEQQETQDRSSTVSSRRVSARSLAQPGSSRCARSTDLMSLPRPWWGGSRCTTALPLRMIVKRSPAPPRRGDQRSGAASVALMSAMTSNYQIIAASPPSTWDRPEEGFGSGATCRRSCGRPNPGCQPATAVAWAGRWPRVVATAASSAACGSAAVVGARQAVWPSGRTSTAPVSPTPKLRARSPSGSGRSQPNASAATGRQGCGVGTPRGRSRQAGPPRAASRARAAR